MLVAATSEVVNRPCAQACEQGDSDRERVREVGENAKRV